MVTAPTLHYVRNVYKQRRDVLVESFGRAGWDVPPPAATMFAWVPIPERFPLAGFAGILQTSGGAGRCGCCAGRRFLVNMATIMCASRWWKSEHRIRQAARNIKRFFSAKDENLQNVIP